jgi:hypothetical protein
MGKYPESEKLSQNEEFVKNVSEFIEFLNDKNVLSLKNGESYLYEMLDVDSVKLESERREMLSNLE